MFSFIPPVVNINADKTLLPMIHAYKIYHSTVINESYCSQGEKRKEQTHCIFHYTVKGSGEVLYKGVPYRTKAKEGFFNIINESNSGYKYPENTFEPWEFIVICFKGGNIREVVKELLENTVIYNINDENKFLIMCKNLLKDADNDITLSFFPKLVSLLYSQDCHQSNLAKEFKKIVEREIFINPTMATVACEMNISREHLQREFLRECGVTPAKYLSKKRFEKLCHLLSTNMSESEIADLMNFPSLSGMTLFFKKNTGITPSQYKKNGYIYI